MSAAEPTRTGDVRRRLLFLWHPALFALVAYLSADVASYAGAWRWLALAATLAFAAVVLAASTRLLRDMWKGALLASLVCVTFLNDAELLDLVRRVTALGTNAREVELGLVAVTWLVAFLLLRRSRRSFPEAHHFLFWLAVLLTVLTARRHVATWTRETRGTPATASAAARPAWCAHTPGGPPDIYFLIFDSRVGPDALARRWAFPDTALVGALRARGFFVADSARSNYQWTVQSLAGTFGMAYVPIPAGAPAERPFTYAYLADRINTGAFARPLRQCGYRFVNFGLYHVAGLPPSLYDNDETAAIRFLQRTTAGAVLTWALGFHDNSWGLRHVLGRVNEEVQRHLLSLRTDAGPTFVYGHLMMPHEPFIHAADGSTLPRSRRQPTDAKEYAASYLEQLRYASGVITRIVDSITAHRRRPQVVLVQGDHGLKEAGEPFSILFAARLPQEVDAAWPARISSVNTFRVVYSRVFGLDYPLLTDTSHALLW